MHIEGLRDHACSAVGSDAGRTIGTTRSWFNLRSLLTVQNLPALYSNCSGGPCLSHVGREGLVTAP